MASSSIWEYQSVTVMIEGTAFSCISQPPDEPRLPLAEHFQEVQVLLPRGCHWLRTGGWNDEPEEKFQFQVLVHAIQEYQTFRLRSTDDLSFEASMSWEVRKQTCDEWALSSAKPIIPERTQNVSQQDVDRVWDKISLYYENMLHAAVLLCAPERFGPRKRKNWPKLVCNYPRFGKLDSPTASFRLRKLRTLEAKLRELVCLEQQQEMHTKEAQNLQQKALRNPLCPGGTWQQRLKLLSLWPRRDRRSSKRGFALGGSLCRAATPSATKGSSVALRKFSRDSLLKSFKSASRLPWFQKPLMSSRLSGSKYGTVLL